MEQERYKDILETALHEIRYINHIIKASSEILTRAVSGQNIDIQTVRYHTETIFEQAYVLSLCLDRIDYEINPEIFTKQTKTRRSLYGKFDKAIRGFKRIAKNKQIAIKLDGDGKFMLDSYPIIDILPYVILENSVKYSPKNGLVRIELVEDVGGYKITITSVGPVVDQGEKNKIFEDGYRGINAQKAIKEGFGRGLALAKNICDIHYAEIKAECGSVRFTFDGCPYSEFRIILRFPT